MIDPKFLELEKLGFVKEQGENFEYYVFSHNDIDFITSATDEPFRVYLSPHSTYWTELDEIKSMIQFIKHSEID
jgi:hypothetical protein